jgi:serine/threonine protein kinase
MEYCPNGDLFEVLRRTGKLQTNLARNYFLQLLDAVQHLHERGEMAHLDIKLENILIGNDFKLRLCDFGFSESIIGEVRKNKGTDGYKAPEIYTKHKSGYDGAKADYFALGVILFILEFGVPPFTIATKDNPYYRCFFRGPNASRIFFRLHPITKELLLKGELDADLSELLLTLLDAEPQNRPKSIQDIKSYPYLQKNIMPEEDVIEEMRVRLNKVKS